MNRLSRDHTRADSIGFAMLIVLGYVMVISILSTAFFKTVHQSVNTQHARSNDTRTYALAESGVHHALVNLATDRAYTGDQNVPFGEGLFSIHVMPAGATNTWIIESTGLIGEAGLHTYTLRATMTKTPQGWKTLRWERVPKSEMRERAAS
ncbi:MAG: hypothetical protein VCB26_14510 [Candidatus Hydrogenedentota bacterium]